MGTDRPRILVTLTDEIVEQIEEYRRRQKKIPTKSEAIKQLIEKALKLELK
jgi:metal-responsive CopG/Arc/MetJ family transcriptional regulator